MRREGVGAARAAAEATLTLALALGAAEATLAGNCPARIEAATALAKVLGACDG